MGRVYGLDEVGQNIGYTKSCNLLSIELLHHKYITTQNSDLYIDKSYTHI